MFAKMYRKLSKMVENRVLGHKKTNHFSTGVRLNQIGGTEGKLPNTFNIYKVLYFKEFIDVNMNIVVT